MDTLLNSDWELLLELMPEGWQDQVKALGGFSKLRRDKVDTPEKWLRLVLLHGGVGLSLQQSATCLSLSEGVSISKPAVWKRLEGTAPAVTWCVQQLLHEAVAPELWAGGYRARGVDGSWVATGRRGVEARLDWAVDLRTLQCVEVVLGDRSQGESLTRFTVQKGDLLIADRGFARAPELAEVVGREAHVIVRWGRCSTVPQRRDGKRVDILPWLQAHEGAGDVIQRPVWLPYGEDQQLAGRLCAVELGPEAAERAQQKARRAAQKKGYEVEADTLAWARWVVVFTTVAGDRLSAAQVLELYRGRWQVELSFKRLKSLLAADQLRAVRPEAVQAWLLSKMLYALLIQQFLSAGGAFSPGADPRPGGGRGGGGGGGGRRPATVQRGSAGPHVGADGDPGLGGHEVAGDPDQCGHRRPHATPSAGAAVGPLGPDW
jgi:hypothetical protein